MKIEKGMRIGNEQGIIEVTKIMPYSGSGNAMCRIKYIMNGEGEEACAIYNLQEMITAGDVKVLNPWEVIKIKANRIAKR